MRSELCGVRSELRGVRVILGYLEGGGGQWI